VAVAQDGVGTSETTLVVVLVIAIEFGAFDYEDDDERSL